MNSLVCFALYAVSGVVARLLCIWIGRYVHAESDGGGWDAGTMYRFYADLPKQFSYNYDEEFGAFGKYLGENKRVFWLLWLVSCVFAFWWWFTIVGVYLPAILGWFFRPNEKRGWRSEYEKR